jgi:hypothetical protein
MTWIGGLILGIAIGGILGVGTMSLMFMASKSDDILVGDRQYDEH